MRELSAVSDAGQSGPLAENTLHQPQHTQRKTSRTLRAVVAAIREVQGMQALPDPADLVPLVGWLRIPVPVRLPGEVRSVHGAPDNPPVSSSCQTYDTATNDSGGDPACVEGGHVRAEAMNDGGDSDDGVRHRILRRQSRGAWVCVGVCWCTCVHAC